MLLSEKNIYSVLKQMEDKAKDNPKYVYIIDKKIEDKVIKMLNSQF